MAALELVVTLDSGEKAKIRPEALGGHELKGRRGREFLNRAKMRHAAALSDELRGKVDQELVHQSGLNQGAIEPWTGLNMQLVDFVCAEIVQHRLQVHLAALAGLTDNAYIAPFKRFAFVVIYG